MQYFDFVYVTSYNECDAELVCGLRDAFALIGKSFAVLGYTSRYVEELHLRRGVTFFNLRQRGPLPAMDAAAMVAIERELPTTLAEFVFPEQCYYRTTTAKLARRTQAIRAGFDRLRGVVRFGCMIHKLGAEVIRRCALQEAASTGSRTVFFGTFPGHFHNRMYLHKELWSERDTQAVPPANVADSLPFAEFSALLTRIRDRKEVIHYPLGGNRRWSEALHFGKSLLAHQELEFLDDLLQRRRELLRFRIRRTVGNWVAGSSIPTGEYYFFPLHVFDDSQITVRNPEYYDQAGVIEHICRVLPQGMQLVVKLHPGLDGAVPLEFLRRVRRLPNLVLLKGSVNAHEVVKRSRGVIVINSTVAFEALLYLKPVLVLGRWAFGRLGMTMHVDDARELPRALRALRDTAVDADGIARTLYNLYGEMYPGSYNRLPIDYDTIASSVVRYLEETS